MMHEKIDDVPYFLQKQYVTERLREEVMKKLGDHPVTPFVFVAGQAYKHHVKKRLMEQGLDEKAISRISYRKDIDVYSPDTERFIENFRKRYHTLLKTRNPRLDRYAGSENQMKCIAGLTRIKKDIPLEDWMIDELAKEYPAHWVNRFRENKGLKKGEDIAAFCNIDFMGRDFYFENIPEEKKERAEQYLTSNKDYGNRFTCLGDLSLSKIANMEISYKKQPCDVANLLYLFSLDELDIDHSVNMLGGEKVVGKIEEVRDYIKAEEDFTDSTFRKIKEEQVTPEPPECSESLLVADKKEILDALYNIKI